MMNQIGMNQMDMNQTGVNPIGINQNGLNPMLMNQMGINQMMDIIINMPSKDSGKIRIPDYTERLKYNPKLKLPDEMIEEEKLDHFYKRYKNRDNNFLNKPRFNNYKVVLPSDFDEESNVNINAKVLLREGIKKQAIIMKASLGCLLMLK